MMICRKLILTIAAALVAARVQAQELATTSKVADDFKDPQALKDLASHVNPFIGTDYVAHTYPGAKWPNGMVAPSPDTGRYGWGCCSGYRHRDTTCYGFSQTHVSGAGAGDMLDVLLQPFVGEPAQDKLGIPGRMDKRREVATPGYYSVVYTNFDIRAELTASPRVAYHRYTFPAGQKAKVLVDLDWGIPVWYGERANKNRVQISESEIVVPNRLRGHNRTTAWIYNRDFYYALEFSAPFVKTSEVPPVRADATAKRYVLEFDLKPGEQLLVKAAVCGTDIAGAEGNLAAEPAGFDFDARFAECRAAWNQRLGCAVPEGPERQKSIFLTALYHQSLEPALFSDADGRFRGTDHKIHSLTRDNERYSTMPLWDIFRASLPLYAFLMPDIARGIFWTMYDEYGEIGTLPQGQVWGVECGCMLAEHAVPFFVDMIIGDLVKVDEQRAFKAVEATLLKPRKLYWDYDYDAVGYIPIGAHGTACSRTLEYCADDAAGAKLAARLGLKDREAFYTRRAKFYRNLWDPSTRMMRARYKDGSWRTPFDPLQYGAGGRTPHFDYTESCGLNYKWHVMQDPEGLVELLGGKDAFAKDLDVLFSCDAQWKTRKRDGDCTGLIGEYAQGNEPQNHVIYFYQYAGRPARTAELLREVCDKYYTDLPSGICGNDDCGQMSAWYVFTALGFYPFYPCGGDYVIGAPQLPAVRLTMPGGKVLDVVARNFSERNLYVKSVTLNGRPVEGFILNRRDLLKGGELVFEMTDDAALSRKDP